MTCIDLEEATFLLGERNVVGVRLAARALAEQDGHVIPVPYSRETLRDHTVENSGGVAIWKLFYSFGFTPRRLRDQIAKESRALAPGFVVKARTGRCGLKLIKRRF
ncbi:MAG: hypothetical protein AAB518_03025 [Patescibacteria group bacterium]